MADKAERTHRRNFSCVWVLEIGILSSRTNKRGMFRNEVATWEYWGSFGTRQEAIEYRKERGENVQKKCWRITKFIPARGRDD